MPPPGGTATTGRDTTPQRTDVHMDTLLALMFIILTDEVHTYVGDCALSSPASRARSEFPLPPGTSPPPPSPLPLFP